MNDLSIIVRKLLNMAQDEGRQSGAEELQVEHVILPLLKNAAGYGYEMIQSLNLNVLTFQLALEQSVSGEKREDVRFIVENLPPSRRLRSLLDSAVIESKTMRNDYVGTEHLLIAASLEAGSVSARFFSLHGVDVEKLRATAREVQRRNKSLPEGEETEENGSLEAAFAGGKGNAKKQKGSFLQKYSRDLTSLSREGKLDPVIGRAREIVRVIQILSRRTKNNPVLLGEPGVGKTAVAEGLAQKIASGSVPYALLSKRVLSLDLTALVAGTRYRGDFEERMKKLIAEVQESKDVILFIDELHMLIGAGDSSGAMDASNILKPALSRGEIQIIGATTRKEYRKYIEKDSALERRFQTVSVDEPKEEDAIEILEGLKGQYESFHNVVYEDGVIAEIVRLSKRYISDRYLPDKAIDILDEAGSAKKITGSEKPPELSEIERSIDLLVSEKNRLVAEQDYEGAAVARDKVEELRRELNKFNAYWKNSVLSEKRLVTKADVEKIVSDMTGIPVEKLDENESARLVSMENEIHETVVGQEEAVRLISGAIRRSRSGVSNPNRPVGSFIFLGPSGVGKTQLAKSLAKFLFGSEDSLIRIDMSDFMEKYTSSRLVGAAPGYIGYEEGGVLTNRVRQKPYSVVLFDEIEKAHSDVFNLLLQILEEGELSDNLGHSVSFRNTVILMTSNAGAREISAERKLGFSTFSSGTLPHEEIRQNALEELKKIMRPELLNRIDDIVVFDPLSREEISKILDIQLAELGARLSNRKLSIFVDENARAWILDRGYDPMLGARPLRRLIQDEIEDALASLILTKKIEDGKSVFVSVKADSAHLLVSVNDEKQKKIESQKLLENEKV